ncbi:mandelate racemase/muconate lactonizing enzyme family protein [Roseomonas sp. CCTCC AB2023176]|uniref:mandelate racemase/muconate lactonizing enzyme family protein n=1 Tax=Roseomonas sp. CCTCC AB2023176 TaxID=3342640 RepID=UPI0035DA68F1
MTQDALRIVEARHWMVRMPFRSEMEWASGRRSGATRLIVRLRTADGTVGWGETICLLDAIPAVLERVVLPIALTKSVDQAEALHRHVLGAGYYHHKRAAVMAICAVEMAMWDAFGRACGQPLHRLWGGLWRDRAEMAAYILAADPAAAADAARAYLDRGHRSFKVKIGMSEATDIALVRAVRDVIGPDLLLRADVNGAWTSGTAKRMLERLRPFDLQYVEQPLELDDLAGHALLRRSQPVPIALDETAYTLSDVGNIVRTEAADVVLLDPHEAGGLWQVVKQAAICEAVGIPVTLHSGGELGPSQAAYLHLAASIPNMTIAIDTEYAHLSGDIVAERFTLDGGCFAVPTGPGLGVTVEEALVERYAVTRIEGAYLDDRRPGWFPVKPAY